MSFGDYILGLAGLLALVAPIAFAAIVARARLAPGWEGAPARLAEIVVAASLLTCMFQLLGAIGAFRGPALVAGSLAIGGLAFLWSRRAPLASAPAGGSAGADGAGPIAGAVPNGSPTQRRIATVIALAAAALLLAHWSTGLQETWARGMFTFDTLWYHGPFAARIAAEGSVWGLHFTDPLYLNWFYPQNSELQHAAGISLFGRDLISPLHNFGWLGLALLAGWCIGRPYGVAPLSLIAVALVMDTGPMVPREAGTLANDVAPVALLLAAAAVLITAWAGRSNQGAGLGGGRAGLEAGGRARAPGPGPPGGPGGALTRLFGGIPAIQAGALIVAGLAIGLAVGTKLTVVGPAAAIVIGAPFLVEPGLRRRALILVGGALVATCGFWFLRNLIHSGSPLPWLGELGPIDLPGPDRGLQGRDPFSVAHYIFGNPSTGVWNDFFYPGIRNLFGPGWPLFFGLAALGGGLAIAKPRNRAVRLCGLVAAVGAIAYIFTPLTAAGRDGEPLAFTINLRYLLPAMALALALLPLDRRLAPPRWRVSLALGGLAALLATSLYSDSAASWEGPHTSIAAAIAIGLVLVAVPVAIIAARRRSGPLAAGLATLVVLAAAGFGWARQDDYLENRYNDASDFRFQLATAFGWAKATSGLRIGVVGTAGGYHQYPLYGDALENRVQYVGVEGPSGDFQGAGTCRSFREAVNAGGYDYLVTTPSLDLNDPASAGGSPERGWVEGVAAATRVAGRSGVAVFRIDGPLALTGCPPGRAGGAGGAGRAPGASTAGSPQAPAGGGAG